MRRDDEAVSAAVATVLLFGGVLSIIGLMMVSMMPVIEEMEGSVERHDMSSQMTLLAHETSSLSERGMPGDVAQATLIPVDGELVWDSLRGGMWYSATWAEDMSLRARGALDFDDTMEIRHPESFIEAVCITDLRLGPDRPYHYTLEAVLDSAVVTVTPGLAMPLGPIDVSLYENGEELLLTSLRVDEMATFDLENIDEATLTSSHALNVYGLVGNGGATYVLPNSPEPADKRGQAYNVNFKVFNALHDIITPQYHNSWLSEYTVQRSAGTLDTYIGFSPYERASGADGFSVSSQNLPLYFEVDIQRVEVSR